MKPHLTFRQYRRIDLVLLAAMLCIFETLITRAAIRWYPDQLYTVSVTAAVTAIVMMRWGPWAAIHAALGGAVFCLAGGGTARQLLIYAVGNLLGLLSLVLIRLLGREAIRTNRLLALLFALCTAVFMQLGRAIVAMLTGAAWSSCLNFFTTDALSDLFAMVIVWITSRLDGVFEEQKAYLLRVQKEREDEKGGY